MTAISFIIPTKDREEILNNSLQALIDSIGQEEVEILVINDSKTSVPRVTVQYKGLRILDNPGKGVASARNFGASCAKGAHLWFLDDDMCINAAVYSAGRKHVQNTPGSVFNFNWVYPPSLQEHILKFPFGRFLTHIGFTTMKGWCKGQQWHDNEVFSTSWLAGATLLISADNYRSVKGYNPSFPLAGFEDYDFSKRVHEAGIKAFIDTTVTAHHNEVFKTSLKGFLERTYNNSITRKHGVLIGYNDQKLEFSEWKRSIFKNTRPFQNWLSKVLDRLRTPAFMDPLIFAFYRFLIGASMYHGYQSYTSK